MTVVGAGFTTVVGVATLGPGPLPRWWCTTSATLVLVLVGTGPGWSSWPLAAAATPPAPSTTARLVAAVTIVRRVPRMKFTPRVSVAGSG